MLRRDTRSFKMIRQSGLFLAVLAVAIGSAAAADLPWVGKWKLNPAKSDFTGSTVTYTQQGIELSYSEQGESYKFKTDGKDYVTPFGYTASWKRIDDHTAQMDAKLNGKVIETDTLRLSNDYNGLTVTAKGSNPNGQPWEDTTVYKRMNGKTGLAGVWKATQVKLGSLRQIEFAAFGADGLTWTIADYNVTCSAKFDGKDYPATGPSAPKGLTVSLKKTGPRNFDLTEKKNGKPVYRAAYTLSADGKTLTEAGAIPATNEKTTAVYDRQ
jgi:hypothetical protein